MTSDDTVSVGIEWGFADIDPIPMNLTDAPDFLAAYQKALDMLRNFGADDDPVVVRIGWLYLGGGQHTLKPVREFTGSIAAAQAQIRAWRQTYVDVMESMQSWDPGLFRYLGIRWQVWRERRQMRVLAAQAEAERIADGLGWPPPDPQDPDCVIEMVTVRDRRAEPWWARRSSRPRVIRQIPHLTTCAECGEQRGVPHWVGPVQVWENPCGHQEDHDCAVRESYAIEVGRQEWARDLRAGGDSDA